MPAPLRLRLDTAALVHNWRTLDRMSGRAACGAAVKANGYGLGAVAVARRLAEAGCRDFFVATWAEAQELAPLELPALSVLHGVRAEDMPAALAGFARPVLNTEAQVVRWKDAGGGACDVMVDTGMNRLGVSPEQVGSGLVTDLAIETLMSHLACADEDSAMNEVQRARFTAVAGRTKARRLSLANSAGIALGAAYGFDLTRPGISLYGGVPRNEMRGPIRQVATPEAQILQRRSIAAGESVGYNAAWTALAATEVAILNIGYADGYCRSLSGLGAATIDDRRLPVLGRVSMDLVAVDVTDAPGCAEGDWLTIEYGLPRQALLSSISQYELLTGLGRRFDTVWA